MGTSRLARLWEFLTGIDLVMGLLWIGLAAFTVILVVLIWTRWGQYRPLRKCLLLSLLAHLLLAGYATTVEIVAVTPPEEPVLNIAYIEGTIGPGAGPGEPGEADNVPSDLADGSVAPAALDAPGPPMQEKPAPRAKPEPEKTMAVPPKSREKDERPPEKLRQGAIESKQPAAMPELPKSIDREVPIARLEPIQRVDSPIDNHVPVWSPRPQTDEKRRQTEDGGPAKSAPSPIDEPQQGSADAAANPDASRGAGDGNATGVQRQASQVSQTRPLPDAYKLRMDPDHLGAARGGGGSLETEAAVRAALKWLAENQGPDGRWVARQHGAGREDGTDGRDRRHAGLEADTGMTGLALLALLASGHTHLKGPYQETVRRGLEFLMQNQESTGSLAGRADSFARMYCHAMATFALSEAYGMTGDQRLEPTVRRAIGYTVAAQDPSGGGWRYRPGDPGDTSQLGWQFMALKSAELAGIAMPERTRQGTVRFLRSVGSGQHGGLASYRPREQVSRAMTAEALVCWQFLGLSREHPAGNEAGDLLVTELPGEGRPNFYYWYYGTLAMYQLQGEYWQRWNRALQVELLRTQHKEGPLAGSWDPDPIWGGYGGRLYSTALGALCLEVYYRYLPLYVQAQSR